MFMRAPVKNGFFIKSRTDTDFFSEILKNMYFCSGEMAEWSIAAVLKTVEGNTSGGSNPSLSANPINPASAGFLFFGDEFKNVFLSSI